MTHKPQVWVKNDSDCRMCLNLSNHQVKMDCYKYSLAYIKHMVAANQKSLRDIKEIKTKKSNYNTTESHQYTRE